MINPNWTSIDIICEGQTELYFVKKVLNPFLSTKSISLNPINIGGGVSIERIIDHVKRTKNELVTMLVDYYGFKKSGDKGIEQIVAELKSKSPKKHFIPYLQVHEIEALWFSNIQVINDVMNANPKQVENLANIISQFETPEDINNNINTAPSKRLEAIFLGYNKISDGIKLAQNIGIETMLIKCPRFNAWINNLIELSSSI